MSSDQTFEFLSEVYIHLKKSEDVYKQYLKDGQTYLHAKDLKVHNLKVRDLLEQNNYLLNDDLQKDSSLLIAHYDAWVNKWEELELSLKPEPGDRFIFENTHTFPKQACKNIENEYLKLQKAKA